VCKLLHIQTFYEKPLQKPIKPKTCKINGIHGKLKESYDISTKFAVSKVNLKKPFVHNYFMVSKNAIYRQFKANNQNVKSLI
jgi:hypothetical protein